MGLTVIAIVNRSSAILQDVGAIRYSQADLVAYASDGQRRIVTVRPDAAAQTFVQPLVAGTLQQVPQGYSGLVAVHCNVTQPGGERRAAIRPIERAILDHENPDWNYRPEATLVEHYVYEPAANPLVWWCYPAPKTASAQAVEMTAVLDPPELGINDTPSINPVFHEALIDYVVARAVMRDSEFGDQMNRAQFHAQLFWQAILPPGKKAQPNATL